MKLPVAAVLAALCLLVLPISHSASRDLGQWENADPAVSEWYRTLMQPDNPGVPCCGKADAYWADKYEIDKQGRLIVTVTDDRDDAPLKRPHIPVGTKFIVPNHKLKYDRGNPTGHSILFVANPEYRQENSQPVYCFVQGSGA